MKFKTILLAVVFTSAGVVIGQTVLKDELPSFGNIDDKVKSAFTYGASGLSSFSSIDFSKFMDLFSLAGALDLGLNSQDVVASNQPTNYTPGVSYNTGDNSEGLSQYDFGYYSVLSRCSDRSASLVWSKVMRDTGNEPRPSGFYLSNKIDSNCTSKTTNTYKGKYDGVSFHRGHYLDAALFDFDSVAMKESFFMINMSPQNSYLNANGGWRKTERFIECERERPEFGNTLDYYVFAGPIWGDNPSDDYFYSSHGVRTPDGYFKLFIEKDLSSKNSKSYAWIFPNEKVVEAVDHLVTPGDVIRASGLSQLEDMLIDLEVDLNRKESRMDQYTPCDIT